MFGGEATTQHVVGVGHDLHSGTAQVGVEYPGGQVQSFGWREVNPVEQQRREDTRVVGVDLAELECRTQFRAEPRSRVQRIDRSREYGGNHGAQP
ncbi:Uncharacterised protein [Mycobacteroides abscessus subsp. abscessus]|nr:Uncharacterised protein [Mycobacteroides abscessus subsp. abscessus]